MKVPQSKLAHYGKWQRLATQYQELKRESDISGEIGQPRLVDDPANVNDIDLWNVILNFRYRQDGYRGMSAVLQALRARKVLWEVRGPSAAAFWGTILNEAVLHEDALLSVWEYAEWLYEAHGVRWPKLHETVLTSFISRKVPKEAIQWHIRLSPNYGLDATTFGQLLQRFVSDPDPGVQEILWGLYQTSKHHQLYDSIVPKLYSEGHLSLARTWRFRLTVYGDHPESFAARPFLRFMAGYFPRVTMDSREALAAGVREGVSEDADKLAQLEGVGGYRQLINRIHGRTFGIKEKTYNDTLGARWFASSWISVDLALDVVRFLGLDRIGPLSLQSIALREGHPDRILERLDQLEVSGISIGDSSYAKAIRHFATMDDHETLMDLLHSDLHPDVFEDPAMQNEILKLAMRSGNWKPYRLVLSVKLAVSLDALALESNRLAVASLTTGDKQTTIRMLEDMHRRGVQILPSTSDAISMHIITSLAPHKRVDRAELGHYVALCRLVMATRFPLATEALKTLLLNLGRGGRLEELERVSLEILQRYSAVRNSTRPTLNIHRLDVPDLLNEEQIYSSFQLIPRELNLRHDLHPIQRIFERDLQHNIIHWSFTARHVSQQLPNSAKKPREPVDFSFARGIRLLALLRDNGVVFDIDDVKQLRRVVELNLATLLSNSQGKPSEAPRWISQLGVEQAKALCDEAWGKELLPPVRKLQEHVEAVGEKTRARLAVSGNRMTRNRTQLDPRIRIMKTVGPTWSLEAHLKKR
ncbi:hypothetical protein CONLIGDRAFT_576752 [Coniochaeta ligniaria NRRL 30616]|uniref:Pentatricopeptide repeat domain-containing protein n=1 Tax=Coniochaeta ligniaria NRRL 30616 TaxID=1408157 RepID=A0A1J7IQW3_9PEZI|nr:hypothetical protein CONLIGDRAFT_576752 [Coniochaeta ligniaria NRRL 30616]